MMTNSKFAIGSALAILAATAMPAFSGVPRKQPLGRYAELWTKSPFTVPPVVAGEEKVEENPLEDYTLAGVCEMRGGWFVVLINKKEREKRVRIKPGTTNTEGFQVVSVDNGSSYLETKVQIQTAGGQKGWVEYDKKFLVLKAATPQAPAGGRNNNPGARPGTPGGPPVPGRPPAATPNPSPRPTGNDSGNRPSRVRRVPTPPSR